MIYYYNCDDNQLEAFRECVEKDDAIFRTEDKTPIAMIEDDIWIDLDRHIPIAFEECGIVYDLNTKKKLYYIEEIED